MRRKLRQAHPVNKTGSLWGLYKRTEASLYANESEGVTCASVTNASVAVKRDNNRPAKWHNWSGVYREGHSPYEMPLCGF
jgi:hypothetical protein